MNTFTLGLFMAATMFATRNSYGQVAGDTAQAEKKVDYLESIYFSGGNKQELLTKIDVVLQSLDGKPATTIVARQYAFLTGIKPKATTAKSCEILELIAAGIYELDAAEAQLQGVKRPDNKTTESVTGIMSNVNGLGKVANNVAGAASGAAWSGWILSGGKVGLLNASTKLSAITGGIGGAAGAIGGTIETFNETKKLLKSFGIGNGDKVCKEVTPKLIQIGRHELPQASPVNNNLASAKKDSLAHDTAAAGSHAKITVKKVSYQQLSLIASGIEKISGITTVSSDDFSEDGTANLAIVHAFKSNAELVGKILAANTGVKLNVVSTSKEGAMLAVKP